MRPDEDRLRLTKQLEAATGASAFAVELVTRMATTMGRSLDPLVPPEVRMKPGELDGIVAALRAQMKPQIREAILVMLLFTYRSLAAVELAEVVAFLRVRPGPVVHLRDRGGLLDIMHAAAARLAVEIAAAR